MEIKFEENLKNTDQSILTCNQYFKEIGHVDIIISNELKLNGMNDNMIKFMNNSSANVDLETIKDSLKITYLNELSYSKKNIIDKRIDR